ncbi:MAG: hypothetical protein WC497_03805 [Patescibacteria group bacterium]
MRRYVLVALLVLVAIMPLGCSRDEWTMTAPGLSEQEQMTLGFSATCAVAEDGWPVYISGPVVPGYEQDRNIRMPFATYADGHVEGDYLWWSWGNEKGIPVWFWAKNPADSRYYRMVDISVGGTRIQGSAGSNEWETCRSFSVYLENGAIAVSPDGPDSLISAQIWYTGTGLPDGRNWPADPTQPVEWLGTWTGFRDRAHAMEFVSGRWTTENEKVMVKKASKGYLRLQKLTGEELRAGVYFGPEDNFEQATLLKCIHDLGNGYCAFEYAITGSGEFKNPRDGDERLYGIHIGGNP